MHTPKQNVSNQQDEVAPAAALPGARHPDWPEPRHLHPSYPSTKEDTEAQKEPCSLLRASLHSGKSGDTQ